MYFLTVLKMRSPRPSFGSLGFSWSFSSWFVGSHLLTVFTWLFPVNSCDPGISLFSYKDTCGHRVMPFSGQLYLVTERGKCEGPDISAQHRIFVSNAPSRAPAMLAEARQACKPFKSVSILCQPNPALLVLIFNKYLALQTPSPLLLENPTCHKEFSKPYKKILFNMLIWCPAKSSLKYEGWILNQAKLIELPLSFPFLGGKITRKYAWGPPPKKRKKRKAKKMETMKTIGPKPQTH